MADDRRLERIERKLDDTNDRLASIDITLAQQHVVLKEHERRSLANEAAVKILSDELKPVIVHVALMRLAGKIVLAVTGSAILWKAVEALIKLI